MTERNLITLVMIGLFTGVVMVWQFSSDVTVDGLTPLDEVAAREELLKQFVDEQSYLQSRIVSLRAQVEDVTALVNENSEVANLKLLDSLKAEIGLSQITGEGLEITLDDRQSFMANGEVDYSKTIQASDLRDLVNILYASSVEGIAINNQRVIAGSPISAVGNTILINNSHVSPPFNIFVVGDTELILNRLLNKSLLYSIYTKYDNGDIKLDIIKKNRVTLPVYNGDFQVNHLNLVE